MTQSPRITMARVVHRLLTDPRGIPARELEDAYGLGKGRTRRKFIEDLKQIPELIDESGSSRVEMKHSRSPRLVLRPLGELSGDVAGSVVSLYFALCMIRFLEGTALEDPMESLYDRLLKGKQRQLFFDLDRKIFSLNEWPKNYRDKAPILRDCLHALMYRKILKIRYRASNRRTSTPHELKIFTLLQYRNGLYLIGKTEKGDRITVFALERITASEKTGRSFYYPPHYDPEDYLEGAFGLIRHDDKKFQVVIRFDPETESYLTARRWHKTAHIKKLKNGTLQLGMRVSALEQVIPWVLSFGRRARVLEPVELKDRVRKEIRAMNKKYGNPS